MSKIKVPGYSSPHFSHSSWLSDGHLLKAPSSGPHLNLITNPPPQYHHLGWEMVRASVHEFSVGHTLSICLLCHRKKVDRDRISASKDLNYQDITYLGKSKKTSPKEMMTEPGSER